VIAKILKNKFLIQGTPTTLQVSETFKLQKFWEEKNSTPKEKSSVQQLIRKVGIVG